MGATERESALRKERADRLRVARKAAGHKTATAAAIAMRVNRETYVGHENGNRAYDADAAAAYAAALGVAEEWLLYGKGDVAPEPGPRPQAVGIGTPVDLADLGAHIGTTRDVRRPIAATSRMRPINRRIPVMGEVAAGLWRDAPAREIEDAVEFLPLDVPGYERASLTALRVVGPSMDLIYPPGRYVVVAHPSEAGLRVGDHVIVARHKADLVELTIKEFVTDEDGRITLWPHSSDPKFQEPIHLKGPGDEADQVSVQIVGVVVADYAKRDRPPAAYQPNGGR